MIPILDACCGGKMFYFDKHDPRVLFQDIRKTKTTLCDGRTFEVNPDVQADFTSMPYPDASFSMVVFDPPHLIHSRGKRSKFVDMYGTLSDKTAPTGWQKIKYGALYKDWRDMLSKGFSECFRVLKPGGFLIFKWNETDIKVSEVLKLTPQQPVFGHLSGKRSNTHWICFMKEDNTDMIKIKSLTKNDFDARCAVYRKIRAGAKDYKDLKDRINAFRAGLVKL